MRFRLASDLVEAAACPEKGASQEAVPSGPGRFAGDASWLCRGYHRLEVWPHNLGSYLL